MKANDLRIGNYVKGSRVGRVKSIFSVNFQVDDFDCISLGNSMQVDFKPIPLTEDWLLKFGFEWRKTKNDYYIEKYSLSFYKSGLISFYVEDLNEDFVDLIDIKYVHQLQNLYFALAGKELVCTDIN